MHKQISLAIILLAFNLLAALSDRRSFRIPNSLIRTGAVLGLSLNLLMNGGRGLAAALTGLLPPLILVPLFMCAMIGAADIKLFMVTGIFLGPGPCLQSMALTGLLSALWSLIRMLRGHLAGKRFGYLYSYLAALFQLKSAGKLRLMNLPSYIGQTELYEGAGWLIPLAPALCLADLLICLYMIIPIQ